MGRLIGAVGTGKDTVGTGMGALGVGTPYVTGIHFFFWKIQ